MSRGRHTHCERTNIVQGMSPSPNSCWHRSRSPKYHAHPRRQSFHYVEMRIFAMVADQYIQIRQCVLLPLKLNFYSCVEVVVLESFAVMILFRRLIHGTVPWYSPGAWLLGTLANSVSAILNMTTLIPKENIIRRQLVSVVVTLHCLSFECYKDSRNRNDDLQFMPMDRKFPLTKCYLIVRICGIHLVIAASPDAPQC